MKLDLCGTSMLYSSDSFTVNTVLFFISKKILWNILKLHYLSFIVYFIYTYRL